MANELKLKSVGDILTKDEWNAANPIVFDNQATGDIPYALSATVIRRLAKLNDDDRLTLVSGMPAWERLDNPARHLGLRVGDWTIPGWVAQAVNGTIVVLAGRVYYTPIYVAQDITVDRIGCQVTSVGAGGTVIRMGIHEWDTSDDHPGTRTVDGGTVAADATATVSVTINTNLIGGRHYFITFVSNGTPTVRKVSGPLTIPVSGLAITQMGTDLNVIGTVDGQGAQASGGLANPGTQPTQMRNTDRIFCQLRISA